jgi:hypothetical protein
MKSETPNLTQTQSLERDSGLVPDSSRRSFIQRSIAAVTGASLAPAIVASGPSQDAGLFPNEDKIWFDLPHFNVTEVHFCRGEDPLPTILSLLARGYTFRFVAVSTPGLDEETAQADADRLTGEGLVAVPSPQPALLWRKDRPISIGDPTTENFRWDVAWDRAVDLHWSKRRQWGEESTRFIMDKKAGKVDSTAERILAALPDPIFIQPGKYAPTSKL